MALVLTQHGINSLAQGGGGGGDFVEIGGRKYPVVKIGSQLWITENLDYKCVVVGGNLDTTAARAWYYNNDENTYGENGLKYGLLYNFASINVINGLLPDGWRVPSNSDLTTLMSFVGGGTAAGYKLKSRSWNGSDEFGFNMLPGGMAWGAFYFVGQYGYLWSTNKNRWNFKPSVDLSYENISADYAAFSVRILKDAA